MKARRKGIGVTAAVLVAVIAALALGIAAVTLLPNGLTTTTTQVTTTYTQFGTGPPPANTTTSSVVLNTTTASLLVGNPVPVLVSEANISCSLASGVCTVMVVNNNNVSLQLETCMMTVIANVTTNSTATVTEYSNVNGTIGGPATAGIPANSQVAATCTVPTAQLAHETRGSWPSDLAQGGFTAKLVDSWSGYPAGTKTSIPFESTWS